MKVVYKTYEKHSIDLVMVDPTPFHGLQRSEHYTLNYVDSSNQISQT